MFKTHTLLLFTTLLLSLGRSFSQTRNGSIDLTGSEGRYILLNDASSNNLLGVEGGEFTFEAWVYMVDNSGEDFNLFRFVSGDRYFCLAYKGDDEKNDPDNVWRFETEGLPEKGGKGDDWNWYRGYNSSYANNGAPDFMNTWRHVAFSVDNGSTVRVYIDGELAVGPVNLTHNGSELADLWPADNNGEFDGKCEVGGGARNSGIKGKFYVGEIRLWDARLSDSEVSKYYDEEVNRAHPHWNDLVRYYHGTESTVSGSLRKFEDRSPTANGYTEYDAEGSSSDVAIESTLSPPVKPPSFNDNEFSISFSANDCQTNNIDVSWTDFDGDSWGYENANDVKYYVTRDADNQAMYDGTGSSFSDNDVDEGDVHSYTLKTYWKVNGTTYYSDDDIHSGDGSIKRQYEAPSNFTVSTDNCDKSIDLSWTASDGAPPKWTVQRANNSGFSSSVNTLTSSLDGDDNSYTANNQTVETDRYFRVYASGNDENGCTVSGVTSTVTIGNTSYIPTAPIDFELEESVANETIKLEWEDPSGNNADSWILKKSKADGSDVSEIPLSYGTTEYIDSDVESCESYRYSISSVNECATDGVYSAVDLTGNITRDLSGKIKTFEASKGYYGDVVRLQWEVDGSLSEVDRFVVYRTRADNVDYSILTVVDNNLIYDDETALGGVFYNYKVSGEVECNANTITTNEPADMGFKLPYGVANGHIEYEGGNAVEGVEVTFEKETGATGNSLLLDGIDDYAAITNMYYETTELTEFAVEAWIKTNSDADQTIASFDRSEYWRLEVSGDAGNTGTIGWGIETDAGILDLGGSIRVDDGNWHHVAGTFDNGVAAIYVDGELDVTQTLGTKVGSGVKRYGFFGVGSEASSESGSIGPEDYFDGNIDEVRVWNIGRSADDIKENYNRFLPGNTVGLGAYWRCDEGIGEYTYDVSKTVDAYNKNDIFLNGNVQFSSDIPDEELLGIRGVTDEYGDYTIGYIPYVAEGEIFRAIPSLGQHVFEPNSRAVYIGNGAETQNNLDFTDISSFTVSGKVTYENSEVPVEGVEILIDGASAVGADNQFVRTDENGDYEINVPIGYHYLSTRLNGHTFSEGYFPALSSYGDIQTYEFTEDITVNFTDDTKIKVAGRIIGGTIQGDLEIGFGLSTNNIDTAVLKLKLFKEGFDINTDDDAIYNEISVTTDEYTGEYELELIPEKWILMQAGNDNYYVDVASVSPLDFTGSLEDVTVTLDTVDAQGADTTWSYTFNHKLNYVIRSTPTVEVYDGDWENFDGDTSLIVFNNETQTDDTIVVGNNGVFEHPIFQQMNPYEAYVAVKEYYSNPNHPDGPLLDQVPVSGADVNITDNLAYFPEDNTGKTDDNGVFYYDFIAGKPNMSTNADASLSYTKTFKVDVTTPSGTYSWPESEEFRAYLLGAQAIDGTDFVSYGPEVVDMVLRDPPGSNSYAYVEQGSSFTKTETWGFTQHTQQGLDYTTFTGPKVLLSTGAAPGPLTISEALNKSELGLNINRDINYDGSYSEEWEFTERFETSPDPEDVGSDADVYIGKATNAYITQTKNLKVLPKSYCITYGLEYYDFGGDYVIGIVEGYAIDEGDLSTYFAYSQRQIIDEVIPTLIVLRDDLLQNSPLYETQFSYEDPFYGINNDHGSPAWQAYIADTLAKNPSADTSELSYKFLGEIDDKDSVRFINNQISIWVNAIATNEAEKASADVLKNISFDGSSGTISETVKEIYSSNYNWSSQRTVEFDWNSQAGYKINNVGAAVYATFDLNVGIARGEDAQNSHSMEFGYVIDERDEGDYYSVDVKYTNGIAALDRSKFVDNIPTKDEFVEDQLTRSGVAVGLFAVKSPVVKRLATNVVGRFGAGLTNAGIAAVQFTADVAVFAYELVDVTDNAFKTFDKQDQVGSTFDISGFNISSPIFSIRGGQTKCPLEIAEYSSFYTDDNGDPALLHQGTLQREVPVVDVNPAVRYDVPETEAATFNLELKNESQSNSGMWYEISIDETTNPDGAVLLIDGLSAERSFYIEAYTTLEKTLTIQKGASGVLEYDSIAIILHSTCQFDPTTAQEDIADTVYVSAHFQPACASIQIDNLEEGWIINSSDNGQRSITLSGWDINHTSLDKIDFQYKTTSGTPISYIGYFVDTTISQDWANFGDNKYLLDGKSSITFNWDISDLTDRTYQIRARATCTDGSVTETDYLTGLLDTETPTVFGTPEPADGIYDPEDDIMITFNEVLQAGLIGDQNISVRGVLNGADVSHGTSVSTNGTSEYARIPNVSLQDKSFTIELWADRDLNTAGPLFSKGSGSETVEFGFTSDGNVYVNIAGTTYNADASSVYTSVYPEDSWHHWAIAYDKDTKLLNVYADDQMLLSQTNVDYTSETVEDAFIGSNALNTNFLAARFHEVRIWETAQSLSETYSKMSVTLSGEEIGLYSYWPLDEANGTVGYDKANARHISINGNWELFPGSEALAFAGSEYATIHGVNVAFGQATDYTVEGWFFANASAGEQTLFSTGRGDLSDVGNSAYALNIAINAAGQLEARSNGFILSGQNNYKDGQWHHFALVVDRNGTSKIYADGQEEGSTYSEFAGLAGLDFYLGTRYHKDDFGVITTDNYLDGGLDEIRIWNTARNSELLNLYHNHKLEGTEAGLMAYHTFETYQETQGTVVRVQTLADLAQPEFGVDANDAQLFGATYTNGAPIADARPVQDISFDFVISDKQIVITPLTDEARLEGQIIEISVSNVFDLNGNRQSSTASWTAYVQRNQVVWVEDIVSVSQEPETSASFQVEMVNKGGTSHSYTLQGVPNWLTVDMESGSINPNSTKAITFTTNAALGAGVYEATINLTTALGFEEQLNISVSINEQAPEWTVDPSQFDYSMNLAGRVRIEGVVSNDANDKVAAFINGEVRGVTNVEYVSVLDEYWIFMTIYGNQGDNIEFQVWDNSEAKIRSQVTPELDFVANGISGSSSNPTWLDASTAVSQSIQVQEGWNWLSFNLSSDDLSNMSEVFEGMQENGDEMRSINGFSNYFAGFDSWEGQIEKLDTVSLFKVRLSNAGTITFAGELVDPSTTDIVVVEGWNWIGYTPSFNLTVEEALTGLNPQSGDIIKGQTSFATYDDLFGWIGSLDVLEPGSGYMLYSGKDQTFNFPATSSFNSGTAKIKKTAVEGFELNSGAYANNMQIIAALDEIDLDPEQHILLAFVNGELRGIQSVDQVGDGKQYFLSVLGNESDTIQFKLYDQATQELINTDNLMAFRTNNTQGSLDSPYQLVIGQSSLTDGAVLMPNPFTSEFNIQLECDASELVVYNTVGTQVLATAAKKGNNRINLSNAPAGVYIVKISAECGELVETIQKL